MSSPFPGMNPYLEQDGLWEDFHHSFISEARRALVKQVSPAYIVKIEEHLYVHELPEESRRYFGRSDVSVVQTVDSSRQTTSTGLLEAPAYGYVPLTVDVERWGYLEIQDRDTRELIAVLELLSPSNKRRGSDRDQFLAKRQQVLVSSAHYVEIDLLRGGPRLPIDELPECDYYAAVSRTEERPRIGLWSVRLRDSLPTIPVPLRAPDSDAKLDLQQLLHRVYDDAGYEHHIYGGQPQPPLSPEDAEWARQFLPASKTRVD